MNSSKGFTISLLTAENMDEATSVRLASWVDTYVNDELGITKEWIQQRNALQSTEKYKQRRIKRLEDPNFIGWVASDEHNKVIGVTTPYTDEQGVQHVGSLYVDRQWHGKGVGAALMQKIIDWLDNSKPVVLGVVTYNERAKAFYRKWGFVEIEGSETLFEDKIPEIVMRREPTS